MSDAIPATYAAWRHCIEVDCGIALTREFIDARLASLRNPRDDATERFERLYGAQHLASVTRWFEQARADLTRSAGTIA